VGKKEVNIMITDTIKCGGGCGKSWPTETINVWRREDAYGIFTGYYCDKCYASSRYPYRKDRYDHDDAPLDEE
jgi:hypothetical protein